ncbi:UBA-like_superfamily [Hexamita inflata]|uniref:UBA-like superfamily n=1 Tax=Hexamita inflata TaxID=28002 RepID=A0AA86QLK2_9EUKA|nr:UBA-like superfamily [Hexamita inflata]CAI9956027.1 UBA-like superfamily [Hexamita inflata]
MRTKQAKNYLTKEEKTKQFIEFTCCTQTQAIRFLNKNYENVTAAINAFIESGEEPENAPIVVKPQPPEIAIKQMMEITNTSREQAIRFLQNNYNKVDEAVDKYFESEPKEQPIVKKVDKENQQPLAAYYQPLNQQPQANNQYQAIIHPTIPTIPTNQQPIYNEKTVKEHYNYNNYPVKQATTQNPPLFPTMKPAQQLKVEPKQQLKEHENDKNEEETQSTNSSISVDFYGSL